MNEFRCSSWVTGYAEVIPENPIRAITSGLPTIRQLTVNLLFRLAIR
jgi:hypothetical protein